ncbi:MAG: hypothetical protein J6D10_03990, partial [Clostridia bacterium]|nr:hypothetical protein [Clostridia bacterium]
QQYLHIRHLYVRLSAYKRQHLIKVSTSSAVCGTAVESPEHPVSIRSPVSISRPTTTVRILRFFTVIPPYNF